MIYHETSVPGQEAREAAKLEGFQLDSEGNASSQKLNRISSLRME
jgi:hypothetical protein